MFWYFILQEATPKSFEMLFMDKNKRVYMMYLTICLYLVYYYFSQGWVIQKEISIANQGLNLKLWFYLFGKM
jgi:hypothetical protein